MLQRRLNLHIFMQVTFLVAGFIAMILMEWIAIQTVGPDHCTNDDRKCVLEASEEYANFRDWKLPMNFTCSEKGILKPIK